MKCTTNQRYEHVGYNSVAIFIRLAVVASQICEILRNSTKIRTCSSSRSSKVIDLGGNRKRICNFLLLINSNYGRISYRFQDIDALSSKIACFFHPTISWRWFWKNTEQYNSIICAHVCRHSLSTVCHISFVDLMTTLQDVRILYEYKEAKIIQQFTTDFDDCWAVEIA